MSAILINVLFRICDQKKMWIHYNSISIRLNKDKQYLPKKKNEKIHQE